MTAIVQIAPARRPHNAFTAAEIEAAVTNDFKVGDGATLLAYSDRRAYTVIKTTPTTITLRRDKATLLNGVNSGEADALVCHPGGFAGHVEGIQRYSYEADPNGEVIVARLKRKPRRVSLPCGEWTDNERGLFTEKLEAHFAVGSSTVIKGRYNFFDYNF